MTRMFTSKAPLFVLLLFYFEVLDLHCLSPLILRSAVPGPLGLVSAMG
jgi:hypothetical protein